MKAARFAVALTILILSVVEVPGHAQNRRGRPRSRPPVVESSNVETTNAGTPEERARMAYACGLPGRPMPAVEAKRPFGSLLCGKAISLPKPAYPLEARAKRASGTVVVKVVVDETGKVIWAEAAKGHQLLRRAAVQAACGARLSPMTVPGRAVRSVGLINYNFQL
jgi:TonB family protein